MFFQYSLLRNKSELQTTIRSLKDTNATFQTLNRELEEKLFAVCPHPLIRLVIIILLLL